MFCVCIDRGSVGTGESNIGTICVLTESALLQMRECYVLCDY